MCDCISAIITPIFEPLIDHVKKHLGFLVSSRDNVKEMNEKMDQLKLTEQDIQHKYDEALLRNHVVFNHVLPWLEEVKNVNKKAQSIPKGGIGCFNVVKRYKTGKQSYNIFKEIEALETRESKIVFTNEQRPPSEVVPTSTGPSTSALDGTQNNFESRKSIYKAALECLQRNNESHKMIALCGMGGIGKTTMMNQLIKEVVFDRVVKVVVGESTDLIALQQAIAKQSTGEDLKDDTKDARADRLRTMFDEFSKQGKKTLVIMDDLWNGFDLKDVGLSPLPTGFKMLFTSREIHVCTYMGVSINSIFTLGFLNDVEAKSLFFGILSDGYEFSFQKIGEDIVNKCRGLPIAIETIAKNLRYNIKEAWEKVLLRLETNDLKDLASITHRIFEISFDNLKEEDDKAIFLLSGLFPDDFDIRTEDLVRYGQGLGLFKDAKTLADARSAMKICVHNLICANLLSESDRMGCVRMHDLVRSFVLSNFDKVKQASIVNHDSKLEQPLTKDANESYDRILLNCTGITKFPVEFNYPNLSMLMLMDGYDSWFPEDIYERMKKLKVLSYENMHIPLLPVASEHLTKLRTLCLRSCSFINDDISFIGNLSNLETLSIVDCHCEVLRLPSTIGMLRKLKLLDVTGCDDLRVDDGVFQNLISLEELYMKATDGKPIRFTDANCDELEILFSQRRLFALELVFFENNVKPKNVHFNNLKRFRISIGCQLEDEEEFSFRNTIQFVGDYNELLECNISDLFDKTEELSLKVNGMNHIEDHSFSNLTVLHVFECASLTYLFTVDVACGLKKLQRLTVSDCPVMRTIVAENSLEEMSHVWKCNNWNKFLIPQHHQPFQNLTDIILSDCPKIKFLFSPPMAKYLSNLKSVYINSCDGIEEVISRRDDENEENICTSSKFFPHLESINLRFLPCLKSVDAPSRSNKISTNITDHDQSQQTGQVIGACWWSLCQFPTTIVIDGCDALSSLIPWYAVGRMKRLQELTIYRCTMMTEVFESEWSTNDVDEHGGGTFTTATLKCIPQLSNLQKVEIFGCNLLSHIFKFSTLGSLKQLKELKVRRCEAIQVIVQEEKSSEEVDVVFLPCLKTLQLDHLPNLTGFFLGMNEFRWPSLDDLLISDCPNLMMFTAGHSRTPKLKCIRTRLGRHSLESCGINFNRNIINDDQPTFPNSSSEPTISKEMPCSFHNLIEISTSGRGVGTTIVPSNALRQLEKLQQITIIVNGSLQEVFELVALEGTNKSQTVVRIPNLTQVNIQWVDKLKYLWKSNQWMVLEFPNLTTVFIDYCNSLEHVFTCSMVGSLVQLQDLHISNCKNIEVVVKEEEEECDAKEKMITLHHLKSLKLYHLSKLKGFCLGKEAFSLPALETLQIKECPAITDFTKGHLSIPERTTINTRYGKWYVKPDLNSFIKTKQEEWGEF